MCKITSAEELLIDYKARCFRGTGKEQGEGRREILEAITEIKQLQAKLKEARSCSMRWQEIAQNRKEERDKALKDK